MQVSAAAPVVPAWISDVVNEFHDMFKPFTSRPAPLSFQPNIEVQEGAQPVRHAVRRLSVVQHKEVTKQITWLLWIGLIRPSASPWSSWLVLVAKKDGSVCMCNDYKDLNSVTRKDGYPLPRIDDMLYGLSCCVFVASSKAGSAARAWCVICH